MFQCLNNDNLADASIPSVSMLEAQSAPVEGIHMESRPGDPSAVAGASILASLSNIPEDLSLIPPSTNDEELQQTTEIPIIPASCGTSAKQTTNVDNGVASMPDDATDVSLRDKGVAPSASNDENLDLDACLDISRDAGARKISGTSQLELLRMLTGSSSSQLLTSSLSKLLEGQRRFFLNDANSTSESVANWLEAFMETLRQAVVDPDNIEVSFENFPYYLRCTRLANLEHLALNSFNVIG